MAVSSVRDTSDAYTHCGCVLLVVARGDPEESADARDHEEDVPEAEADADAAAESALTLRRESASGAVGIVGETCVLIHTIQTCGRVFCFCSRWWRSRTSRKARTRSARCSGCRGAFLRMWSPRLRFA